MSDIIRVLPDSVANQIAAGEVIQRPASVVKELVENAVDAGANSISIIIKDAGRTLIQVVDNGKGMTDTDARMAFERHATSKIRQADDLFSLHTMGFRGEALASICAVAQVDVRTMVKNAAMGTRLLINGSRVESQTPQAGVPGTNMMVKNLFFNIPARRKFLKKDAVEMAAIMREFERLALVNPGVEFTLIHNEVTLHSLRRAPLLSRIGDLFGRNLDKQLIPVAAETSIVKLDGYIGLPENARRRNPLQYLFVNGRNMRHPYFHKAVLQCYDRLLPPDQQPNYFLNFTVDPATIDVNIHPTKNEIKFENEQEIWQILTAAIRESLGKFNVVPSIDFDVVDAPVIPTFAPKPEATPDAGLTPGYNPFNERCASSAAPRIATDWESLYDSFASRRDEAIMGSSLNDRPAEAPAVVPTPSQGELEMDFERVATGLMQFKNRYILSPCREGLMVIDQHRAHQRVLFERYMKCSGVPGRAQQVIFPETLSLSPSQNSVLDSILGEIEALGFALDKLGEGRWNLTALPVGIGEASARDMLLAMLDAVAADAPQPGEALHRTIAMAMASTGAVRPGQPLNAAEIDRLVGELLSLPAPGLTPDGRRVFAVIPTEDIAALL